MIEIPCHDRKTTHIKNNKSLKVPGQRLRQGTRIRRAAPSEQPLSLGAPGIRADRRISHLIDRKGPVSA